MKKYSLLLLFVILTFGCSVVVDTEKAPFVINEITIKQNYVIFNSYGMLYTIKLPNTFGYAIGDTIRIERKDNKEVSYE